MARGGVVEHPQLGAINLYRFSSAYWGERLYAEITAAPLSLSVELRCETASDLMEYRPALEVLLESVELRGAQVSRG